MNYLEKKIEDACHKTRDPQVFHQGIMSPEAKEYWQQGMYTEEEVYNLLNVYLWNTCLDNPIPVDKWFEQNKKK